MNASPELDVSTTLANAISTTDARWNIIDSMEDGFYLLDRNRRIIYWNEAAKRITGFDVADVLGQRCADAILMHVDHDGCCLCEHNCPLAGTMQDGVPRQADVFLHHKEGHRVPVRVYGAPVRDCTGGIIGAFETFSDQSAALAQAERLRDLEQAAFIDVLTSVANRRFLDVSLESRLAEKTRHDWGFGVVLLDVDHFKRFNDEHGHEVGDHVLQMVARTLARNARPYDVVGRWGGEEFLIIASHSDLQQAYSVAERARVLIGASELNHQGQRLRVTVSAGVAVVRSGEDAVSLLRRADTALYASKNDGRNRVSLAEES